MHKKIAGIVFSRVKIRVQVPQEMMSYDEGRKEEEEEVKASTGEVVSKDTDCLDGVLFLSGNPQVRILSGKLRFYRPDKILPIMLDTDDQGLPKARNLLLCIVTVPSHMSPVELLDFLAFFRHDVSVVRILKDPERSNCMALLQFTTQERADQFFLAHNGKYFNSIELERCKIVFVRSIEIDAMLEAKPDSVDQYIKCANGKRSDFDQNQKFLLPPTGMTEIPTCAVCLDRLDASASGIVTTLCNHTFHCDCLFRWEGSSCPVCRFSHSDIRSACEVCDTTNHLWICLICGHVGCGRYSGEHAKKHYQETLHAYSLELETQRVWDYAGDGYVHRLILNKHDGKFVEIAPPNTISGERSQIPPTTSEQDQENEHRKLEKLAVEYNWLLKSQLEEQRLYYERLLTTANQCDNSIASITLEQEVRHLKKSNEILQQKATKSEEELDFVRELNKSLIENQHQWKARIRELEEQKRNVDKENMLRIGELEAQVRDLMFYLDTQSKVERSAYKNEIQGGVIQTSEKSFSERVIPSSRRKGKKK